MVSVAAAAAVARLSFLNILNSFRGVELTAGMRRAMEGEG
jgi:hypothetical protein